jgi:transportin-1
MIQQFVRCFDKYKDRNMFILYDCVQTLAEYVGPGLAQPDLVEMLMPALLQRWRKVSDQSRELFPLLECLSYVATALGIVFAPFAPPIFSRCIKIIHQNLEDYVVAVHNPSLEMPDTDFLVTSLDLLSAIIQGPDTQKSEELVSGSQPAFFELLSFCMENPTTDVRQSSYALLGDCARYVFPQLQPFLPKIMPILIKQLDLSSVMDEHIENGFSVVNNACWSAGEIAIQHGKGMGPYVEPLFRRLLDIIGNPEVPHSVNENAGIALGRLGLENSEAMAPHLANFADQFLSSLETVDYTEEKASAFTGFTMIVGRNPQAMEKDLMRFFTAIARYRHDLAYKTPYKEDLRSLFAQVRVPPFISSLVAYSLVN